MTTLGLNPFGHDSSAAIIKDGVILAASAEERFNRIKHSSRIPKEAIDFCLKQAGLDNINDVEEIALGFNFWHWKLIFTVLSPGISAWIPQRIKQQINQSSSHLVNILKIYFLLREELGYKGRITFREHHDCHAAACYFASQFNSAAIITLDGRGEKASTRIYHAQGTKITKKFEFLYPNSLGGFYSGITEYLGFMRNCDEGKVMGLASYGDDSFTGKMRQVLNTKSLYKVDSSYFKSPHILELGMAKKFERIFGKKRNKKEEITEHHQNIAKAAQTLTEEAILNLVKKAKQLTGESNLCLGGGVALNSVTNGKIAESKIFDAHYIYPAAGDDGISVGAAFLAYYQQQTAKINDYHNRTPYLGYSASDPEIQKALEKAALLYTKPNNLYEATAKLLSDGKFIGWYQGAAEFGPRALGNRTILADPRKAEHKDLLNAKVKFREPFRPFAPSVLQEYAQEYFTDCIDSPYMIITYMVKENKIADIPAVTHVDQTARVQTVTQQQNERYYKLIQAFYKLTGVPVVLNTSFNVMNEPIVNTPEDAIRCFKGSGLDALVIGNYLIVK